MKKLRLNHWGDCIVDENNRIVDERPSRMREWPEAEEIIKAFNRASDNDVDDTVSHRKKNTRYDRKVD